MKLLILGDTQLNSAPPHDQVNPDTQRSTRFEEGVDTIAGVIDQGLALGAQGLLHLGDLTEHKAATNLERTAAAQLFRRFLAKGEYAWIIAGNHDGSIFKQSSSSIEPLAVGFGPDRMKVFHEVEVDMELGMLAVPYIHKATQDQVREMIRGAWADAAGDGPLPKKAFFGACHYGAQGTGEGRTSRAGFDNREMQNDFLNAAQLLVHPLDQVFGGHIHAAQDFPFGPAHFWHPGSCLTQNKGERADGKSFLIFNTLTRQVERFEIKQPRRFVVVPYSPGLAKAPEEMKPLWAPEDIVSIEGEFEPGDQPHEILEQAFKLGQPRPFSLDLKGIKLKRKVREGGAMQISTEAGMQEALKEFVREKFVNKTGEANLIGPATEMALSCIQEQGLKNYCPVLQPESLAVTNLFTFKKLQHIFHQGIPVLITGENGRGKTNFLEVILWIITGETSKGMSLGGVVNRYADAGEGVLTFLGAPDGDGREIYRITRGVKISKAGKATQSLRFEQMQVGQAWKDLSDGSMAEIQKLIDALVGGSYQSVKTSGFKFQNSPKTNSEPFIAAHPTERKAILAEILGLQSLSAAFKILDKKCLGSLQALKSGEDRLAGMLALGEDQDARLAQLEQDLAEAELNLGDKKEELAPAVEKEAAASRAAEGARIQAKALQDQLDAQPNTAAALAGAEQGLASMVQAHEAARAPKAALFEKLKAEILTSEQTLAATKAPEPAVVAGLEIQVQAAGKVYEDQRAQLQALQVELGQARAAAEANDKALAQAREQLTKAQGELAALPAATDEDQVKLKQEVEALEKQLKDLEIELADIIDKAQKLQMEFAARMADSQSKKQALEEANAAGEQAQRQLADLPAAGSIDQVSERARIQAAEDEVQALEAQVLNLTKVLTEDRGLIEASRIAVQKLVERGEKLKGKTAGECDECGQPVTEEHIKQKLQDMEFKGIEEIASRVDIDKRIGANNKALGEAVIKKSQLQAEIKSRGEALAAVAVDLERRRAAEDLVGKTGLVMLKLNQEYKDLNGQVEAMAPEVEQLVPKATEGKAKAQALVDQIKSKRQSLADLAVVAERRVAAKASLARCKEAEGTAAAAGVQSLAASQERALRLNELAPKVEAASKASASLVTELQEKKDALAKVAELQGQLTALRQQAEVNTAAGIKEAEDHKKAKAEAEASITKAKVDHDQAQRSIQDLRAKLEAANAQVLQTQGLLNAAAVVLTQVREGAKALEQRVKDLGAGVKAIRDSKAAVEAARFEIGSLQQQADIDAQAAALVDPKVGLPAHLVDGALPFLEDRINIYMDAMGAGELVISFAPFEDEKDSLGVFVDDGLAGRKPDICAYSGGQLERVEYALKFAMQDLVRQVRGVTLGLMAFDEPSGGLQASGKEALVRMLHDRIQTYPVTMIISHDEALIRAFDHRLSFTRLPDGTTVIQ